MAGARDLLFRIFYSTSYTFVFVILLAFIVASPSDTLYQSWRRRRVIDIAFIAGTYVVTGLLALLIYASRLYTNRSVLSAIPKTYMPIDQNELPKKRIWTFISDVVLRSAVVALQAKPRSHRIEIELPGARDRIAAALNPEYKKDPEVSSLEPQWGRIEHPGWSSPAASNLPNLEYRVVVAELTDLIEAKAVSLAPVDPHSISMVGATGAPDEGVVELVARPDAAGMREYITQLIELGVIPDASVSIAFLAQYERARFAPEPITEEEFQSLMRMFAEVLRTMKPIDPSQLDLDEAFSSDDENHIGMRNWKAQSQAATIRESASRSTLSSAGSVRHVKSLPPARVSEDSVPSQATDESVSIDLIESEDLTRSTPTRRSRTLMGHASRMNSSTTSQRRVASTQRPILRQQKSQVSILSSRSGISSKSSRSTRSNTGSVVVRLNSSHNQGDQDNTAGDEQLPYVIEIPR